MFPHVARRKLKVSQILTILTHGVYPDRVKSPIFILWLPLGIEQQIQVKTNKDKTKIETQYVAL